MDERVVEELQTKIAFLERANAELSDVLYRHEQDLKELSLRLKELSERLESGQIEPRQRPADDERPPHY